MDEMRSESDDLCLYMSGGRSFDVRLSIFDSSANDFRATELVEMDSYVTFVKKKSFHVFGITVFAIDCMFPCCFNIMKKTNLPRRRTLFL